MKFIVRLLDRINDAITWITVIMLAVMVIVVFSQVVFRFLHLSIPWSEELSKYLMIWCAFLGSALCARKGSLIGLEFINAFVPQKGKQVLRFLIFISTAAFLILLIYIGFITCGKVWMQSTPVLKLPMGLMYAAIPIGAVFMLLNTVLTVAFGKEARVQ